MLDRTKDVIRPIVPEVFLSTRRKAIQYARRKREELPLLGLKYSRHGDLSFAQRKGLVDQLLAIHTGLVCKHTHEEMVRLITAILDIPRSVPGCIVEAGCFKGGSTAKLSLAAKLTGRKLIVFDSFEGLPQHDEDHGRNSRGQRKFAKGLYAGQLDEVKDNVRRFGDLASCEFVKGWFDQTMPGFREPVVVAYVDVDLALSTRTCLQYLYPLLVPGGAIFSQDGHIPLCVQAMDDDQFWRDQIGFPKPVMPGLRKNKLVEIPKSVTAVPSRSAD